MQSKRIYVILTLLTLLVWVLPGASFAYQVGNADVKVTGSLKQAYDDNISYASTNTKADAVTSILAGIDAGYDGKNDTLHFNGRVARHQYAQLHTFSNTDESAAAQYARELSKYSRLSVSDDFVHAEEPRSFEDAFGRTTGRYSYYRNTLSARFEHDITRQLGMALTYDNSLNTYSRKDLTNSNYNDVGVEGSYALNSKTLLFSQYQYSQRQYEHTGMVHTNRIDGGLRQYFTDQLYFDGRLGEDFITTIDKQSETGQYILASLTDEIDKITVFRLSYTKETASTVYSRSSLASQRVSLSAGKQLFPRFRGSLNTFYGTGDYTSSNTQNKLFGIGAGCAYELIKKLTTTLEYSYSKNTSNVPTSAYTRNYVACGLTYQF